MLEGRFEGTREREGVFVVPRLEGEISLRSWPILRPTSANEFVVVPSRHVVHVAYSVNGEGERACKAAAFSSRGQHRGQHGASRSEQAWREKPTEAAATLGAVASTQTATVARSSSAGLTSREIYRIVNRYIGVSGGYLGDFSYRTRADFYPEYCDLDIDPYSYEGTTRERFIAILSIRSPHDQARIIRGVLEKYPVGSSDLRTTAARDELVAIAERLERGPTVSAAPAITSEVVRRAIDDAEALLLNGGPTSAVDRVHTTLHGHLQYLCAAAGIQFQREDTTVALLKKLRQSHPKLQDLGPRGKDVETVLRASGSILDALNPMRNNASVAHPNEQLLGRDEAQLVINVGRSVLAYVDGKLAE